MPSIALLLLLSAPAPAVQPDPQAELRSAERTHALALIAEIERSGSAREKAMATQLARVLYFDRPDEPCRQAEKLRKAAVQAPTDRFVQGMWAAAWLPDSCQDAERHGGRTLALARLEPDNIAAWLYDFPGRGSSASQFDAAIHRLAGLDRYEDIYIEGLVAWTEFSSARASHWTASASYFPTATPDPEAEAVVRGSAFAAAAIGAFPVQFFRACDARKPMPGSSAQRFSDCAKVGRSIYEGATTVLDQRLGLALQRRASPDPSAFDELQRRLDWRMHQSVNVSRSAETNPGEFIAWYRDVVGTRSEIRAQELALARAGIPLEPPADWTRPGLKAD